ncbi:MAG TPA: M24 family metallopeptidase [Candidatus Kapabacteria bacterium]|nr:M24 family metallopeptidase [Candidatus Kapabacteria bacterium]HPO61715.1 M24 family metallopeptidase [Candidatus Kapabacteria bacterium]
MDLLAIQKALKEVKADGWLFYDFHNRDAIAARILNMDTNRFASRRWFYFIPSEGEPKKLVHAIEPWRCDHLPGEKLIYLEWKLQHKLLKDILANSKNILMQYSPNNAIPYVSIVDGGTIDLIRSFGVNVQSSADLVSIFESHLSMDDLKSHKEAGVVLQMVKDEAFKEISRQIKAGLEPTEFEIYEFMKKIMYSNNMTFPDGPIVAINEHAADPHFEPTAENSYKMKEGDLVLIDLWAKKNVPGSIFYDITWMGYIGSSVPDKFENVFQVIKNARDAAVNTVKEAFANNSLIRGCDVDDACRNVVVEAGYGKYFIHRTGHNIGEEVHGNGVHIDNLETKDERVIIPGTCFSVEPGIYMPEEKMGFRTEVDVFVSDERKVEIFGAVQQNILALL